VEESKRIHREVRECFANTEWRFLWDDLKTYVGYYDRHALTKAEGFLQGAPFLLLFEERQDNTVIRFEEGCNPRTLLSCCKGFEFYLTDEEYSYLLCFNFSNLVAGSGDAVEEWLDATYAEIYPNYNTPHRRR
jgi:hypothetical protein